MMLTYICFCYVCCIPIHHKGKSGFFLSPWSHIWRVFVRCGAGRRTHRPFCGARRRQSGKMEPDKDSKIEAKRIRNTQKRAFTHNWTIPGRGPEFEPLGVQMESKWDPLKYVFARPFKWPLKILEGPLKGHLKMRFL